MNTFHSLQQEINNGISIKRRITNITAMPLLLRILLRGNNEQYFGRVGVQQIMNKYVEVGAEKRLLRRNKSHLSFAQWHRLNSRVYMPFLSY